MSTLKAPSLLFFNFSMVFLNDLFLFQDLFSSSYTCTTPLSTVISNSAGNHHHLYADDTQLFLSFFAADFAYNIPHLEHTISNVYNWMSSNFLSLNPSKTEILLVGLPQHLSKLSNPIIHLHNNVTLSPVHFARNLGVIFDSNLTFSQQIFAVSKSCFYHIRDSRRIRNNIDHTTAWLYYCHFSHPF